MKSKIVFPANNRKLKIENSVYESENKIIRAIQVLYIWA